MVVLRRKDDLGSGDLLQEFMGMPMSMTAHCQEPKHAKRKLRGPSICWSVAQTLSRGLAVRVIISVRHQHSTQPEIIPLMGCLIPN